jgi:hypothetical protein
MSTQIFEHSVTQHSRVSDEQLLSRARSGDQIAFGELCLRYTGMLKQRIFRIVRNREGDIAARLPALEYLQRYVQGLYLDDEDRNQHLSDDSEKTTKHAGGHRGASLRGRAENTFSGNEVADLNVCLATF